MDVHSLKVIFVGSSGVGKTSILKKYRDATYNIGKSESTIGLDCISFKFSYNNKNIKVIIYDTAGQERFKTLTAHYFHGTHIVFLVFDYTKNTSCEEIEMWYKYIHENCQNPYIVLVGNKTDLTEKIIVNHNEVYEIINKLNINKYFQVSAKSGVGINNSINDAITSYLDLSTAPQYGQQQNIVITEYQEKPKNKKFC